jgi:hypothetical protein
VEIAQVEARLDVERLIELVPKRKARLAVVCYALHGYTLAETGKRLGVSGEQARRLVNEAIFWLNRYGTGRRKPLAPPPQPSDKHWLHAMRRDLAENTMKCLCSS